MNYQVKWNDDGSWETVFPDGYGMHEDERHGAATLQNVLDEEAFILTHGNNAIRFMRYQHVDEDGNPIEDYAIVHFFNYSMPDHQIVKFVEGSATAEEYLLAEYPNANYQFDDDYECPGCWNPETGDPGVWFAAIFEQGACAARCGSGSVNQHEYTADEWRSHAA